jgi:hypothetical protein
MIHMPHLIDFIVVFERIEDKVNDGLALSVDWS